MAIKCKVIDLDNKAAGDIELPETVFGVPVRKDILARVVNWQLAKRRAGTHKTRTVSEVRGSGRKPWRQKGTGRARVGSLRAGQFRGGAAIFGPVPRDHGHALPKKVRKLGLRIALSSKQADGKLIVLSDAKLKKAKTAELVKRVGKLGWDKALVIDGPELDENFARAVANLRGVNVLPTHGANVYDILRCDTLVLTKSAVEQLEARLS